MKKFLIGVATAGLFLASTVKVFAANGGGFNEYGYNYTARIFNGTGLSWCNEIGITDVGSCNSELGGPFSYDKLVMKWNAQWDNCNNKGYTDPTYCLGAWLDNEWNGNVTGGSGAIWHYKIIWVGPSGESSQYWVPGGELVWGNYEIVMDQGTNKTGAYTYCGDGTSLPAPNNGGHIVCSLSNPSGYGAVSAQ